MGQGCRNLPTVRQAFDPAEVGVHAGGYKIKGTVQVPTVRHHVEVESSQGRPIEANLRDSAENVSDTVDLLCPLQLHDSV